MNNLKINILLFKVTSALLLLIYSCNSYKIKHNSSNNHKIDNSIAKNEFNEINLNKYRDSLNSEGMDEIINYSNKTLKTGSPEGILGNFITDLSLFIIREKMDNIIYPDFCVLNNGGFRANINKGAITRRNIFELMPFENSLVILELNNYQMDSLLNYILNKSLNNNGVPISGLRINIVNNKIYRCLINTKEISKDKTYHVLTTDYLSNGGDNMFFLKDCKKYNTGILLRDAIINYIKSLSYNNINIDAQIDGRVQINK